MLLKAGSRLKSAVCDTEVIVVRAPSEDTDLRCGGVAMLDFADERPPGGAVDPAHGGGTLLGKRYADESVGIELLCTKPGDGSLSIAEQPLLVKEAKPLPASD
jgi:hypothetical protein